MAPVLFLKIGRQEELLRAPLQKWTFRLGRLRVITGRDEWGNKRRFG